MGDQMAECPACGEKLPEVPADQATDDLTLNGETFEFDKLSYGERRAVKKLMRQIVQLDNPNADPDEDWTADDVRLAFATVCARRSNPVFSLEEGLALTPAELKAPVSPPTKRKRAVKVEAT